VGVGKLFPLIRKKSISIFAEILTEKLKYENENEMKTM
jgi:hypothetical protein